MVLLWYDYIYLKKNTDPSANNIQFIIEYIEIESKDKHIKVTP